MSFSEKIKIREPVKWVIVAGVPGGMPKFEEKHRFPGRSMQKKTGNHRGVVLKSGQIHENLIFSIW